MNEEFSLEWEERDDSVPFYTHMIAGSFAGLGEHVLLLPIDNIKTHVQTTSPKMSQAISEIRYHGISNFFKGSAIIAAGVIPAHAIFFTNYEIMKKYLNNENKISIFGNMALGGISTLFHDLIMTPADLIKQRAQILKTYSLPRIIKNCYQTEGLRSFWRSLPINLFSNLPSQMITVSMNENLKVLYNKYNKEHTILSYFLCASLSGFVSSIFVTPLDNIKTRLNVQILQNKKFIQKMKFCSHQNNNKKHFKQLALKRAYIHEVINGCSKCAVQNQNEIIKYPNTLCAVKIIKKEEGFQGFYKGFMLRTLSQSLSAGISWTIYEVFKRALLKDKYKQLIIVKALNLIIKFIYFLIFQQHNSILIYLFFLKNDSLLYGQYLIIKKHLYTLFYQINHMQVLYLFFLIYIFF